jgi:hypothetical protein
MQHILDLAAEIRQLANDSGIRMQFETESGTWDDFDGWVSLCVAIDTLEDATGALLHFETFGPGITLHEQYLKLYGMFQAVFLQQESIARLYEVFLGRPLELAGHSHWATFREIGQAAVASRVDSWRLDAKRAKLTELSITPEGFFIIHWDKDAWDAASEEAAPRQVDVMGLLHDYKQEAVTHLETILHVRVQPALTSHE